MFSITYVVLLNDSLAIRCGQQTNSECSIIDTSFRASVSLYVFVSRVHVPDDSIGLVIMFVYTSESLL